MDFSLCPLEPAWGTVADYVAAAISLGLGLAVYQLSRRTHQVSEQAVGLSERAVALQQDGEAKRAAHDRGERDLLLIRFVTELSYTDLALKRIADELLPALKSSSRPEGDPWKEIRAEFLRIGVPSLDAHFDRLHVIGNPDAARLVRLAGSCAALQELPNALREVDVEERDKNIDTMIPALRNLHRDTLVLIELCKVAQRNSGLTK
ncbi:hypothetical protein GCM10008101_06860 [Lysobacter xinjiangensis]|uniref:Uncharacterized protein n=1 Tax=Cognatilysobacter xinjiangensis TaxID=546892 RepID=A0ABQ3BY14_9GAMM|nr:hypothetical protein [Lysobacter xinjiangensis]GGZ56076.1 hypothetical protein GCM10008101_06860 [Lysobacter xinjiangensis]